MRELGYKDEIREFLYPILFLVEEKTMRMLENWSCLLCGVEKKENILP